jgi:hypothetical protein
VFIGFRACSLSVMFYYYYLSDKELVSGVYCFLVSYDTVYVAVFPDNVLNPQLLFFYVILFSG